jgi:hypothetical protein
LNHPSLPFGISSADFEVFLWGSAKVTLHNLVLSSRNLSLSFRDRFQQPPFPNPLATAGGRNLRKLAPLGFHPLQHMPVSGVCLPGVCLAPGLCAFRVSYPLSGLLLRKPLNHVSGSSVRGVHLFRVFLPSKSRIPLRIPFALMPFHHKVSDRKTSQPRLQSLYPFEEPYSLASCYAGVGAHTLLRFPSLRHPLVPALFFKRAPSSALSVHLPNR